MVFVYILCWSHLLLVVAAANQTTKTTTVIVKTTTTEERIVEKEIVNSHNFSYILNPGDLICGKNKGEDIFLLVYVHTAPGNFKRRLAIRETWSNVYKSMRVVFMMGHNPEQKKQAQLLDYEQNLYGDLVQENFYDSYRNLTYKGIMALRWISEHCSGVKFILKTDDDIIVNIFVLWNHLKSLDKYALVGPRTIMCNVWGAMKVMRDKTSKWYLSKSEFKNDQFGKYCSGSAFVLTTDLALEMQNVSKYVKFFWVDDYYISGLLARASHANYTRFNSMYILNSGAVEQRFKGKEGEYTVFGHVPKSLNKLYDIWSYILVRNAARIPNLSAEKRVEFKRVFLNEFKWSQEIFEQFY